jgi:N-acetylglucosaminyldiphosphoundecaprenol N-acetyl-beta-D-mannosaminyltransferase
VELQRPSLASREIVSIRVDATTYSDATERIIGWAKASRSAYVAVANVHMAMEAYDSPAFAEIVNAADLVTPDGMPLVWMLRALGAAGASRVYGPDLTLHLCEGAAREKVPIGLYGGTPASLRAFAEFLERRFPGIRVVAQVSPPFRPLTPAEDEELTAKLRESGARIVLVGIGCPKQERWMAGHLDRLQAVLVGVGAAFDFHSGRIRQAPALLQRAGFEWAFRLAMEPRRLFRRYAVHNPRFIALAGKQLLRSGFFSRRPRTT